MDAQPTEPPRCPNAVVFFLSLFIYFERVRDSTSGGGAERERLLSRLYTASTDPDAGLGLRKPQDHDLS